MKRLARGDVAVLVRRIERSIERAEDYVYEESEPVAGRAKNTTRDIAVVAGLALAMLGVKALKVLPSIPFAPGHKMILVTPLYVVAALKTHSRFGATLTGLVMGTVAFLLGDGRYGVFEIPKHVLPGLVCDLLVFVLAKKEQAPGKAVWTGLGLAMGLARFAANPYFVITLFVRPPAVAWAILVPALVVFSTFGVLSGFIGSPLMRALWPSSAPPPASTAPSEEKREEAHEQA